MMLSGRLIIVSFVLLLNTINALMDHGFDSIRRGLLDSTDIEDIIDTFKGRIEEALYGKGKPSMTKTITTQDWWTCGGFGGFWNYSTIASEYLDFALDDDFEPVCTCQQTDNSDEIDEIVPPPDSLLELIDIVDYINQLIGALKGTHQIDCSNSRETCFGNGVCGVLESSEWLRWRTLPGQLTVFDVLTGNFDAIENIEFVFEEIDFQRCINYTSGETGKLCFGANLTEEPKQEENFECTLVVDDKKCSSCNVGFNFRSDRACPVADTECLVAECPIFPFDSEEVDVCAGQGLSGVFQFFDLYYPTSSLSAPDSSPCGGKDLYSRQFIFLPCFEFCVSKGSILQRLLKFVGFGCGGC